MSTPTALLVHTTQSQVPGAAHMSLDQLWKQPKLTTEVPSSREAFATSPLASETSLPGEPVPINRPLSRPLAPAPISSRDEERQTSVGLGSMDAITVGGVTGEGERVDPLMLKYMELVMQRREKEKEGGEEGEKGQSPETKDHSQSEHSHVSVNHCYLRSSTITLCMLFCRALGYHLSLTPLTGKTHIHCTVMWRRYISSLFSVAVFSEPEQGDDPFQDW